MFTHSVYAVQHSAAKPHHGPVLAVYVKGCLKAIEEVQLREETSDA